MNNLSDWLLLHYGQEEMVPGLSRIREALSGLLPSLQESKIIIIAGTNGKGETSLKLSRLLKEHSHVVWTSPHIVRLTERMRDETGEISLEELRELIKSCHEKICKKKIKLSYYEFLFYVFCTWAHQKKPEYLILEVGLGGRLDAVNVFDADLVLLPSISRDHQGILGNRLDEILSEKLGTLRKKTKLIHFLESRYLQEKALNFARMIGAEVLALEEVHPLPHYDFSFRNEVLANAAYCHLLNQEFLPQSISSKSEILENRGDEFHGEHHFTFYGSHNVDGLRKLIQFLHSGTYNLGKSPFDGVIVAFSKRDQRDLRVMLRMLMRANLGEVVVTSFEHPKALDQETAKALAHTEGSEFVQNIESYVQGKNTGQRLLVTGSYYFIGHFKSLFCRR